MALEGHKLLQIWGQVHAVCRVPPRKRQKRPPPAGKVYLESPRKEECLGHNLSLDGRDVSTESSRKGKGMRVIGSPNKSGGITRKTKKVLKENKEAQERLSVQTAKPILQKKEDK